MTMLARPVRAPSAMPEADSTNTVFELAEPRPPAAPARPSTNSARPTLGSWPSSRSRPASLPRPVIVPMASKKSASTRVNTSSSTVIAGSRVQAPNETWPTVAKSGVSKIELGHVGTLSPHPSGL